MAGALYYPSWSLNDPVSFGEFLLYWDRLTFMTPSKHWDFPVWADDPDVECSLHEAHERYALTHLPTDGEKSKCDRIIRRLFKEGPEDFAKYAAVIGKDPYNINARKLADETVKFLKEHEVFKHFYDDTYVASEAGGHLVMAVLALCCSSQRLPPVTTDDAQFTLQMLSVDDSLAPKTDAHPRPIQSREAVVSMLVNRVKLPKAKSKDPRFLRQVLVARNKDQVNGYRTRFQSTVTGYCERLMEAASVAEIRDILANFDSSCDADLKRLQREVRAAGVDAVMLKNGAVAVVIGVALGTASLELGALGGTVIAWRTYRKNRQNVFKEHWTSWLHQIEHPHFSIW